PDGSLYLLPGHPLGGVAGRFVRLLVERGRARLLPTDPVIGLEAPAGVLWGEGEEVGGGGAPTGGPGTVHRAADETVSADDAGRAGDGPAASSIDGLDGKA